MENDILRTTRGVNRMVWLVAILVSALPLAFGILFPRILLVGVALTILGPLMLLLNRSSIQRSPKEILIGEQGIVLHDWKGRETQIAWEQVSDVQRHVSRFDPSLCLILYRSQKGRRVSAPVSGIVADRVDRGWSKKQS